MKKYLSLFFVLLFILLNQAVSEVIDRYDSEPLTNYSDVGIIDILLPEPLYIGTYVMPQAIIGNFGDVNEACQVRIQIKNIFDYTFYDNTKYAFLHVGDTMTIRFDNAIVEPSWYIAKCFIKINDSNPSNNVRYETLVVLPNPFHAERYRDLGIIDILIPDTLYGGQTVTIPVSIKNYGTQVEINVLVSLHVGPFYTTTVMVVLAPGESTIVGFGPFYLSPGTYYFKCIIWPDDNPANNAREKTVVVLPTNIEELLPKGKNQEKKSTITRISDFKSQCESKKLIIFEPTGRPTNPNTLKPGVYFLRVTDKEKTSTHKILLLRN